MVIKWPFIAITHNLDCSLKEKMNLVEKSSYSVCSILVLCSKHSH